MTYWVLWLIPGSVDTKFCCVDQRGRVNNPDVYNVHCSYSKQLLSLFDPLAHMEVGGGVERNGFL